ncbi:hypothetical protein E1218_06025 [Kribbella turkmenica]|uniref:Uncharacterized protein n=1 Tax=Kribbella turkmenica TaxID=2530375 RepID=A0A4V2YH15_9ACTN|nr:hypothetical protein [Kribbella turkmenica]TDD28797.1 hypothetical protein E1218_06025 [Kribbella turkmenica]
MRREDIRPLLYQAADRLPEPDLADTAWAGGLETRRRQRRNVVIGLLAALALAVVLAIGAGVSGSRNAELVPPPTTPSLPPGHVPPEGQIAGIDYWLAPPAGSERFLDRVYTPLGDRLGAPDDVDSLTEHPIENPAALMLEERNGRYDALLLGGDSTWARADLQLAPISSGSPLSSGAVSPDGRTAAFPQPGELVTLDVVTAEVSRYPLPTRDLRSVAWTPDAQQVLVSGPGKAYRVHVRGGDGEQSVVAIPPSANPASITAPFRIERDAVLRYRGNGEWAVDSELDLPVRTWVGQTFSTYTMTARLFVSDDLQQVPTKASQPQVVAAISTLRALPSSLLVLGEADRSTPAMDPQDVRQPGCCAVLGWYDDYKPVIQVRGWLLAWDVRSGRVQRVTELAVDGVALGPGIRP